MASAVLSIAGQVIGNSILPGIGGTILGGALALGGSVIGGRIDSALFGQDTLVSAPRLESLKLQDSRYGASIPFVMGRQRIAGQVIYASDLIETITYEEQETGGGKGMGGGGRTTIERVSYSINVAIAFCRGEVSVRRIWADNKLVYHDGWLPERISAEQSSIYSGTTSQGVDPLLQGVFGSGNVPAYRGVAYAVMFGLQLSDFGNRLPNFTFEVERLLPAPALQNAFLAFDEVAQSTAMARLRGASMIEDGKFLLIGVKNLGGTNRCFRAVIFTLSGGAPVLAESYDSASFTSGHSYSGGTIGMSVSPNQDFAFAYAGTGSPSYAFFHAIIFDVKARTFGSVYTRNVTYATGALYDQVNPTWLDSHHIVHGGFELVGGNAAFSLMVRGYRDLAPVNDASAGYVYTGAPYEPSFVPRLFNHTGGAIHVYTDAGGATLHFLSLANGRLKVDAAGSFTYPATPASVIYTMSGATELTAIFMQGTNVRAVSYAIGSASVTATRAAATILSVPAIVQMESCVLRETNRIAVTYKDGIKNKYIEIGLTSGGFTLAYGAIDEGQDTSGSTMHRVAGVRALQYKWQSPQGVSLSVLNSARVSLGQVVRVLLEDAGYAAGDIVTTDIDAINITGFVLQQATSARAAIEALRSFYPFEVIERDGQLVAVKRDSASVLTIPASDLRAVQGEVRDGVQPDDVLLSRVQELDLPAEIIVNYSDEGREYEPNAQRARRITGGAINVQNITLPIVLTRDEAKQVAERELFTRWVERERLEFTLPYAYIRLDAGDVVTVSGSPVRIESLRYDGGVLTANALPLWNDAFTSAASGEGGLIAFQNFDIANNQSQATQAFLLDLPLLLPEHDKAGMYMALAGNDYWRGGVLYRSADGVSYLAAGASGFAAVSGITQTALTDVVADFPDRANTLRVTMLRGVLSGATDLELLNGANLALVGDELIQFRDVSVVSTGVYDLSYLHRGRLGTEAKTAGHAIGERFLLINSAIQFTDARILDNGLTYQFKAVSNGLTLGQTAAQSFTYGLGTLKPRSPAQVKASRDGSSNATITWVRRARLNSEWVDGVEVPLDEPAELYDLEILDGGGNVLRTFSGLTSGSQSYTAAQQITDFGSTQSAIAVRVYQISGRIGRGHAALATV